MAPEPDSFTSMQPAAGALTALRNLNVAQVHIALKLLVDCTSQHVAEPNAATGLSMLLVCRQQTQIVKCTMSVLGRIKYGQPVYGHRESQHAVRAHINGICFPSV